MTWKDYCTIISCHFFSFFLSFFVFVFSLIIPPEVLFLIKVHPFLVFDIGLSLSETPMTSELFSFVLRNLKKARVVGGWT